MRGVGQWVAWATQQLRDSDSCDTPELDAQVLVCHVLGVSRTSLYAFPEQTLSVGDLHTLDKLLARRLKGEPIAYIVGSQEFWSLELRVGAGALVPRADTEVLVDKAIELSLLAPEGCVVDLGTGTGAIAIALAQEMPERAILAIERSDAALPIAQENIRQHASRNTQLLHGSWLDCVGDDCAAMVVANPPYLAADDPHLLLLEHEPVDALVSGVTGLEDLEHIIADTLRVGKTGAPLILEHGYEQGAAVRRLLLDYSYANVNTGLDLAGHERISFGFVT